MDINAFLDEYQLYIGPLLVIIMMPVSFTVISFPDILLNNRNV